MKGSLKSFLNRCRCCLSQFAVDEQTTPVTEFFEIQFFAFTNVVLERNERLSSHICEYCHTELLRFSVFKKELIEKQKELYAHLARYNERKRKKSVEPEVVMSESEMNQEDEEYYASDNERKAIDSYDEDYLEEASSVEVTPRKKPQKIVRRPRKSKVPLTCDHCNQKFHGKQGMVMHMNVHKRKKRQGEVIECSVSECDFKTDSKNKLRIHKTRYHNQDRSKPLTKHEKPKGHKKYVRIPCHCGCKCWHAKSLYYHMMRIHGGINDCVYGCKITFSTTDEWLQHIKDLHSEHELICTNIAKAIKSVLINKPQEKEKNNNNDKQIKPKEEEKNQFECPECRKIFKEESQLENHKAKFHNAALKFKCTTCGKRLRQLCHLRDHLKRIHKADDRPYTCWCDEIFTTKVEMKAHKLEVHDEVMTEAVPFEVPTRPPKKFMCFCKKIYSSQKQLTEHQTNCVVHENSKKEDLQEDDTSEIEGQCPICGKSFTCRSNLLRHQKIKQHYTKEQIDRLKFSCDICHEKFFSKTCLTKHHRYMPNCKPK